MKKSMLLAIAALVLLVTGGCGTGPDAPTGLTIDAATMTLSWTAVSGAKSYTVYRGTTAPVTTGQGNLSTKTILAQNINTTTYKDSSAVPGTVYYYQVVAVGSDSSSRASNEVSATPQSSGSNTFILGGQKNGSQIDLNWSNVSGATTYNVYRSSISSTILDKQLLAAGTGLTSTTFSDTTLTPGNTYFYQVSAINSTGTSIQISNEASVSF